MVEGSILADRLLLGNATIFEQHALFATRSFQRKLAGTILPACRHTPQ